MFLLEKVKVDEKCVPFQMTAFPSFCKKKILLAKEHLQTLKYIEGNCIKACRVHVQNSVPLLSCVPVLTLYDNIFTKRQNSWLLQINPLPYMACNTRKGTFGCLHRVSFQISMPSPYRLIWNDTFRFMYLFCLQKVYFSTKSDGVVKCRLGLVCADSAG